MPSSPTEYIPQTSTDRRPLVIWAGVRHCLTNNHGNDRGRSVGAGEWAQRICVRRLWSVQSPLSSNSRALVLHRRPSICGVRPLHWLVCRVHRSDARLSALAFIAEHGHAAAALVVYGCRSVGDRFFAGFFGIWENTHLSRFLTGALLGSVAVFYVVPGLLDLRLKEWRQLLSRKPVVES